VLGRLRSHGLLAWDNPAAVYRITPLARNVLAALDTLLALGRPEEDEPRWASCCRRWPAPRRWAASPSSSSSTCWAA
jgi:hypothetical protein